MNARVARLERREAQRLLGERTKSVVGDLRKNVLTFEARATGELRDLHVQVHRLWDGLNKAHEVLSRSFWGRLRWLVTGK